MAVELPGLSQGPGRGGSNRARNRRSARLGALVAGRTHICMSERRTRVGPRLSTPDHPDLHALSGKRRKSDSSAYRRIFCAAATSADYALLSPCVQRCGYGAPQRRVCDESFACYVLWEPTW